MRHIDLDWYIEQDGYEVKQEKKRMWEILSAQYVKPRNYNSPETTSGPRAMGGFYVVFD